MSSLFNKLKTGSSGATSPNVTSPSHKALPSHKHHKKDVEPEPEITPLVKMLQNAGPIRNDGSDKFFGLENFGNTCYCNSIMQALYYSVPFREHVVKYPPHSPSDTPNGQLTVVTPIRKIEQSPAVPAKNAKGITASEAMRRRTAINAGQQVPQVPGQRPEDKPDSPEYKKKHAMLTGPVLDLTYENASSYGMEESTFTALKDIFIALISNPSRTGVLSPQRFLEIFRANNDAFRTTMHQDAHEFYGLVLNDVISNVEANALKIPRPMNGDASHQSIASAAHAMGLYGGSSGASTPGTRWVHEIFEGLLTSETKCLTCENASQRDETFLDLSIDLENHSSVTSCLRNFSAEEMLCERNKFHCDNCGGLQEAEKRMKIKRLPKILVLHLKRFKWTEDMTRLQKLFHRVVYPYYLRMFNTTDDAEDPDRLYELYAVVVHIGGNAYHGHYVSVIKTQDRGWLLFDDEMVEPVDKNYVRNFFGDKPGMACAYVLFYQETTVEAMRKEQEAESLAEVELANQEAALANGLPQANGHTKPVSVPSTPIEDEQEFASLNHAVTEPIPLMPQSIPSRPIVPMRTPSTPVLSNIPKPKTKDEKEREKKELKEAEKARKVAEKAAAKEKHRAQEQKLKDQELAKKEYMRQQSEEARNRMAAQRVAAAAEEEERKKKEAPAATVTFNGTENGNGTVNGTANGHIKENGHHHDKGFNLGSLSRKHQNSKSMSRKSFGFLNRSNEGKTNSPTAGDESSANTAVEGDSGPPTPEKHSKFTKDRFSFSGLGRKKSNLMNT